MSTPRLFSYSTHAGTPLHQATTIWAGGLIGTSALLLLLTFGFGWPFVVVLGLWALPLLPLLWLATYAARPIAIKAMPGCDTPSRRLLTLTLTALIVGLVTALVTSSFGFMPGTFGAALYLTIGVLAGWVSDEATRRRQARRDALAPRPLTL
ncbi:hypothetical protein [Microbacterium sp. 77mftsu3.1]|uniref:hypothetical protein n=1 Tax=Microbacterium sp. 77mftsu3.1 TaxID=1761802 RepID=UPI000362736A|nr:hypothetical protein [Microbacterium sp. 77mftsu3.1]SDH38476.1 hypothetical protein SAMN04488590_3197 [Microbacterium sp. 77mftsu3.1]